MTTKNYYAFTLKANKTNLRSKKSLDKALEIFYKKFKAVDSFNTIEYDRWDRIHTHGYFVRQNPIHHIPSEVYGLVREGMELNGFHLYVKVITDLQGWINYCNKKQTNPPRMTVSKPQYKQEKAFESPTLTTVRRGEKAEAKAIAYDSEGDTNDITEDSIVSTSDSDSDNTIDCTYQKYSKAFKRQQQR